MLKISVPKDWIANDLQLKTNTEIFDLKIKWDGEIDMNKATVYRTSTQGAWKASA